MPRSALLLPAMLAAAFLFAPFAAHATATASVSINGVGDEDVQFVTAGAMAVASGAAADGTVDASANLASGTLKAKTQGVSAASFGGFLDATATAELADVLFLTPLSGTSPGPVSLTLFMDLDAGLLVGGNGIPTSGNLQLAGARALASLGITGLLVTGASPASLTVTRRLSVAGGNVLGDDTTVDVQQNVSGIVDGPLFSVRLLATATVTPGSAINVGASITALSDGEAGFSSSADLSQTAQLGVFVPQGYALSSSSGVFLTVPEPRAAGPLALAAVALLRLVRQWSGETKPKDRR